ncbi:MAG: hypothetical protein L0312_06490, partial [Acidobacteria bacterium]|nr:hypothetical protein [Acidobacteriota bacterium]
MDDFTRFNSMTLPPVADTGRGVGSIGLLQWMQNLAAGKLSRPHVGQFIEIQLGDSGKVSSGVHRV